MPKLESFLDKKEDNKKEPSCAICFDNHPTEKHKKAMVWRAEEQFPVCDYCGEPHKTAACPKNLSK